MKNFTSLKKHSNQRSFVYLKPAEQQGKEKETPIIEKPEASGRPVEDIARGYKEGAEKQLAEIESAFDTEVSFENKSTEKQLAECEKIPDHFVRETAKKLIALIAQIDEILGKKYLTEREKEKAISEIYIDLNRIAVSIKTQAQSGDPLFRLHGNMDYGPKSESSPVNEEIAKGLEEAEETAKLTAAELAGEGGRMEQQTESRTESQAETQKESPYERNVRLANESVRELLRLAREGEGSLTDEQARVIATFIQPGNTAFLEVDGKKYNLERSVDGNYVRLVDVHIEHEKKSKGEAPGLKSVTANPILALRPDLDTNKARFAGSTSLERERKKMAEAPENIGMFMEDMAREKTGTVLILNTSVNREKSEETVYQLFKKADGTYEIQTLVGSLGPDEDYAKDKELVNAQPYNPLEDANYSRLASISDVDQLLMIPYTPGQKPLKESPERREQIEERVKLEIGKLAQNFADAGRIGSREMQRKYLEDAGRIARENDIHEGFFMEKKDTTFGGKIEISVEGAGNNREIVIKVPGIGQEKQVQRLAFLDLGEEEGPEAKKMAA